ncbi:MAG: caspase family protein [Prevotellaceae bacterium]|jgi:hypothetical protein|nr:caspase family protein [Prevotellaceae bacterium]
MKRKALLIGNSNGLSGVKLDIRNFTMFLKQDVGGQWYDSEIVIKMNPLKSDLIATISSLKSERNDFMFVVFSGHGAYQKGTVLEINGREEVINESDLKFIAPRQVSVFDCCRNLVSMPITESLLEKSTRIFSSTTPIRAKYNTRIMQAIEQQVSLYACSVNESALDTETGGLYINNLLKAAGNIYSTEYKLVGIAHEEAKETTKKEAWNKEKHNQNPTATLPKCLSSQQLIISINPNSNNRYW